MSGAPASPDLPSLRVARFSYLSALSPQAYSSVEQHLYACVSRQSMNASVAAITQAMTLAQRGMRMPFTVISHPKTTRSNCSNATSAKTTTATVVKGFNRTSTVSTKV